MNTKEIEEKRGLAEVYLKKCGYTQDALKRVIADLSIDWFEIEMPVNKTLLVRIVRGRYDIDFDYYRGGSDGYSDYDRFWYEFPVFPFRYLPSGWHIGEELANGDYEVFDPDNEENVVIGTISQEELKKDLIDDLTVRYSNAFLSNYYGFLVKLHDWIILEEQNEKGGEQKWKN